MCLVSCWVETVDGKPLVLNETHNMGAFIKGSSLINFNAYLQGESQALVDRNIGLGAFYTALSFTLSYD